jgi:hypothetical protein
MSVRLQVVEYTQARVKNGVIEGVKICGTKSRNGRHYPQAVLDAAINLYEEAPVYVFHGRKGKRERNPGEHFGALRNVHAQADGKIGTGLYGDLHVKQSHPMAQFVLESDGRQFGLSHNADVDMNDDETEVLKILAINSVDLVDDPATTVNLFEEVDEMTLEEFQAEQAKTDKRFEALEGTLATVLEAVTKEPEKPKGRITALEAIVPEEGAPTPIGNSHEAFLDAVRGFSTIDTKGAQA